MEKQIEQLEIKYPNKAIGVAKFNISLAHMITAGADFMLIPSRFEPCGLIQLHAMRYGTVKELDLYFSQFVQNLICYLTLKDLDELTLQKLSTLPQVPICATTGGLVDTVKEGFTGFHMGPFNVEVSLCFPFLLLLRNKESCS